MCDVKKEIEAQEDAPYEHEARVYNAFLALLFSDSITSPGFIIVSKEKRSIGGRSAEMNYESQKVYNA